MIFSESLKKNQDFRRVYNEGSSYANHYFVVYALNNRLGKNRIGISVSKKVGNSVNRHHITRLVREAYRRNEEKFLTGVDLVVIARVSAKDVTFSQTEKSLLSLSARHKLLKSTTSGKDVES